MALVGGLSEQELLDEILPAGWATYGADRKRQLRDALRMTNFRATYRNDWVAFAHDCIDWEKFGPDAGPTEYQDECLAEVQTFHRVAVRGPHGLGKTGIGAIGLLAFALTRDGDELWKAPVTASVWRQLKEFFWPEVHIWARRLLWAKIGRGPFLEPRELQDMALRLSTGAAFAVASNEPSSIEGAHADQVLYIFDEAKTIPGETFEAAEGAFSGAGPEHPGRDAYALALSTPGEPQGPFYKMHKRDPSYAAWRPKHVTVERAIEAGRVAGSWVQEKQQQWGTDSALFQNRVLGNFAASSEQSVIPLTWVEAAVERWKELRVQGIDGNWAIPQERLPAFTNAGLDVADQGEDRTTLARRYGDVILDVLTFPYSPDPMESAGQAVTVLRGQQWKGFVVVDAIGVGAGTVARLRELKASELPSLALVPFVASGQSTAYDASGELGFANLRAEAWWGMRERLDPSQPGGSLVCLPDSDTLLGDLTAPRWKMLSRGVIQIESKEDIRKRLKRSTDEGDGVVMSFWARPPRVRSWSPADARLPGA